MGYEKDILPFLRMNSNPCINHGESRVYHQFRRNCISSKRSFVYHHCEKKCSLRLMIYTFGDEMHAYAWWYTIAFAMDKKSTGRNLSIFGGGEGNWTPVRKIFRECFSECSLSLIFPQSRPTNRPVFSVSFNSYNAQRSRRYTFTTKWRPNPEPWYSQAGRQLQLGSC